MINPSAECGARSSVSCGCRSKPAEKDCTPLDTSPEPPCNPRDVAPTKLESRETGLRIRESIWVATVRDGGHEFVECWHEEVSLEMVQKTVLTNCG